MLTWIHATNDLWSDCRSFWMWSPIQQIDHNWQDLQDLPILDRRSSPTLEPCLVNDGVMSNKVYSASHKLWMKLSVCVFNSYSECCQFFHSTWIISRSLLSWSRLPRPLIPISKWFSGLVTSWKCLDDTNMYFSREVDYFTTSSLSFERTSVMRFPWYPDTIHASPVK